VVMSVESRTPFSARDRTSWVTVFVTFINFSAFHAVREGYAASKSVMASSMKYPTVLLGVIDAAFCIAYAIGLFFSGLIGKKYGVKKVIMVSFASTASLSLAFGVLNGYVFTTPTTSTQAWETALVSHLPIWVLSGFVQSLAYPNFIALLSDVIEPSFCGIVISIWAIVSPVGDIIGLEAAKKVLQSGDENWPYIMFLAAAFMMFNFFLFVIFVVPVRVNIDNSEEEGVQQALLGNENDVESSATRRSPTLKELMWNVWNIPGVIDFALSVMCLKVVVTSVLFWLPYYMDKRFDSHGSSILSTQVFDVSLIVGMILTAAVHRAMGQNRWVPIFMTSLFIGIIPIALVPLATTLHWTVVCIFFSGALIGPSSALFASVMGAEIGKRAQTFGTGNIVGVISGFIDSSGAVGSGLGQLLVGFVASSAGWTLVFEMLAAFTALGALCLIRVRKLENERNH
jgi:sugar phosphate permease